MSINQMQRLYSVLQGYRVSLNASISNIESVEQDLGYVLKEIHEVIVDEKVKSKQEEFDYEDSTGRDPFTYDGY